MTDSADRIDDDDNYWELMGGGHWSKPALEIAAVARLLGVTASSPADLQRRAPGFPPPCEDHGSPRWAQRHAYEYILGHAPHRSDQIPRLNPFTSALGPARYLFGDTLEGVAVHAWQPADGRGPIAVAYIGPGEDNSPAQPHDLAERFLTLLPWATAVAIPETQTILAADKATQPYVVIAERARPRATVTDWFTLVGLLRVDLPWWSACLRDIHAIAAWQPGNPMQRVRPRAAGPDPRLLLELLSPDSPDYVTQLVHRTVAYLDQQVAGDYLRNGGHDHTTSRRGLVHAAVADAPTEPVAAPTAAETAMLLHQPCINAAVIRAIRRLLRLDAVSDTFRIRARTDNLLAQEWISRLIPGPINGELGYGLVAISQSVRSRTTTPLRDPLNPHCWILHDGDTVYVSTAPTVPATGQLTELHFDAPGGFFRDSAGNTWPLPFDRTGVAGCGPRRSGSAGRQRLWETITKLVLDAGGDIDRRDRHCVYNPRSPLGKLIAETDPPLIIERGSPVLAIAPID